jgi:hypothetical protein
VFLVLGLDLGVLLLDFGFGDELLLDLGHCGQVVSYDHDG